MAESLSAEYRALVSCTDKMITLISTDPVTVTTKLFTRNMIPTLTSSNLQTTEEEAIQIVKKITNLVKIFPEKFELFLAVLNEIPLLQDLVKMIREEREKIKMADQDSAQAESESETSSISDTEEQMPPTPPPVIPEKKFPYLNAESLSEKEKERLIARLEVDSEEMRWKFAILVDRTRESLERQRVTCNQLSMLLRHSKENKLFNLTAKSKNVPKLFLKLADHWSFFDHEFLKHIIERHTPELKPDYVKYELSFKEFCKRRLCELPADIFGNTGDRNNLYVKTDINFTTSTLQDVKKLECRLSKLLDTELCLLRVEKGYIKLTFACLNDISTPLTSRQMEVLKELQIIQLYSDNMEYYSSKTSAANHLSQSGKMKENKSAEMQTTGLAVVMRRQQKEQKKSEVKQVQQNNKLSDYFKTPTANKRVRVNASLLLTLLLPLLLVVGCSVALAVLVTLDSIKSDTTIAARQSGQSFPWACAPNNHDDVTKIRVSQWLEAEKVKKSQNRKNTSCMVAVWMQGDFESCIKDVGLLFNQSETITFKISAPIRMEKLRAKPTLTNSKPNRIVAFTPFTPIMMKHIIINCPRKRLLCSVRCHSCDQTKLILFCIARSTLDNNSISIQQGDNQYCGWYQNQIQLYMTFDENFGDKSCSVLFAEDNVSYLQKRWPSLLLRTTTTNSTQCTSHRSQNSNKHAPRNLNHITELDCESQTLVTMKSRKTGVAIFNLSTTTANYTKTEN